MINRTVFAGLCILAAAATRLPAQGTTAEVFGGYTYTNANPEAPLPRTGMNGWNAGAAGYATKWFGAGAEISGVFGSLGSPSGSGLSGTALNTKEYSYMAGPQFRFIDTEKLQTSVKVLFGGVFGQANLPTSISADNAQTLSGAGYAGFNQTKFAMMFAAPVDVSLSRLIAIRVEPGLYMTDFAPAAAAGSVGHMNQKQWNFRMSIGPVFRFGHSK